MALKAARTPWASILNLGLLLLNTACSSVQAEYACERRVIVHFLQPVTAQQGTEILHEVLAPMIKEGLQVNNRTQVAPQTISYALAANGCRSVDRALETLSQASGRQIRAVEPDGRPRVQQ